VAILGHVLAILFTAFFALFSLQLSASIRDISPSLLHISALSVAVAIFGIITTIFKNRRLTILSTFLDLLEVNLILLISIYFVVLSKNIEREEITKSSDRYFD
jgi:hypothetical protein